jgi:succinate dehydrogenase flavin-adding protein (antitoxin of CptAB toxin-antitoxin module)
MDKTLKTPLEDLRKQALEHYNEAATAIVHYNSFVRDAILAYDPEQSHKYSVMQGLPDSEIYKWLDSKKYQREYEETGEYRMLFEIDFPKIIREFVTEHLGSPTVANEGLGKAGD